MAGGARGAQRGAAPGGAAMGRLRRSGARGGGTPASGRGREAERGGAGSGAVPLLSVKPSEGRKKINKYIYISKKKKSPQPTPPSLWRASPPTADSFNGAWQPQVQVARRGGDSAACAPHAAAHRTRGGGGGSGRPERDGHPQPGDRRFHLRAPHASLRHRRRRPPWLWWAARWAMAGVTPASPVAVGLRPGPKCCCGSSGGSPQWGAERHHPRVPLAWPSCPPWAMAPSEPRALLCLQPWLLGPSRDTSVPLKSLKHLKILSTSHAENT